jgi:hypothetical protein
MELGTPNSAHAARACALLNLPFQLRTTFVLITKTPVYQAQQIQQPATFSLVTGSLPVKRLQVTPPVELVIVQTK